MIIEWQELELGWKNAFKSAWEEFKLSTTPIGCVIQNENDKTVAIGKIMIHTNENNGMKLFDTKLAHAEINAILLLNENEHPNISKYTLYTTMEPCVLCFGALVMGNLKYLKYAARDTFGGATSINMTHEFTKRKNINITRPIKELEHLQIIIESYYKLKKNRSSGKMQIQEYTKYCAKGMEIAYKLFENKILDRFSNDDKNIEYVYNKIMELI
jgi:tRNA(adenine34) deaminase